MNKCTHCGSPMGVYQHGCPGRDDPGGRCEAEDRPELWDTVIRDGMLSVAREALEMVPECADWTVEHGFSPLDRLQMRPPQHFATVKSSDARFQGGMLLLADDIEKGPAHIADRLRARLEAMASELRMAGLEDG